MSRAITRCGWVILFVIVQFRSPLNLISSIKIVAFHYVCLACMNFAELAVAFYAATLVVAIAQH